jgi:organic hydroperoxide reductase OsmC/OhrA
MAHAKANIGTTNYAVSIMAGHHQLSADERAELGGQDVGPAPYELLCAALCACTAITLRMYAERKKWPLRGVHVDVRHTQEGKKGGWQPQAGHSPEGSCRSSISILATYTIAVTAAMTRNAMAMCVVSSLLAAVKMRQAVKRSLPR